MFFQCQPSDEDGYHWGRQEDSTRHTCGRDGDHLVTPFQCDLCVFRNQATVQAVCQTVKLLQQVDVPSPYPPLGPHEVTDSMGYGVQHRGCQLAHHGR